MIGCRCDVCRSTDTRNQRTRASILVCARGKNILVDTSTDLRLQAISRGIDTIDAVLYTHAHADHVHGIDELRSFSHQQDKEIPCYGRQDILEQIQKNFGYIFDGQTDGWKPRLCLIPVEKKFDISGFQVVPIEIFHGGSRIIYGYRFGNLAYLTDCSGIPDASRSMLEGLEVLILDATRYQPHPNHLNYTQAIALASQIAAKRTILTHLSHAYDHETVTHSLPDRVELAYDGMIIELPMLDERQGCGTKNKGP